MSQTFKTQLNPYCTITSFIIRILIIILSFLLRLFNLRLPIHMLFLRCFLLHHHLLRRRRIIWLNRRILETLRQRISSHPSIRSFSNFLLFQHIIIPVIGHGMLLRQSRIATQTNIKIARPVPIDLLREHHTQRYTAKIAYHRPTQRILLEIVTQRTLLYATRRRSAKSAQSHIASRTIRCVVVLQTHRAIRLIEREAKSMSLVTFVLPFEFVLQFQFLWDRFA